MISIFRWLVMNSVCPCSLIHFYIITPFIQKWTRLQGHTVLLNQFEDVCFCSSTQCYRIEMTGGQGKDQAQDIYHGYRWYILLQCVQWTLSMSKHYPNEIISKVKVNFELATIYDYNLLSKRARLDRFKFKFRRNKRTPSSGQLRCNTVTS